MYKILLMGPQTNRKKPEKTGGIIVLFEQLLSELNNNSNNNFKYHLIDTNKSNYSNVFFAYISIIVSYLIKLNRCSHISLHGTAKDFLYIAPIIVLVGKVFQKKISLRKFAGNFDDYYLSINKYQKKILLFTLKNSDINFFETKSLVKFFGVYNTNTHWFPNTRKRSLLPVMPREFNNRFVFISQVKKEKGIDDILKVAQIIPAQKNISIYGPILDKQYSPKNFNINNVKYKGSLESKDVLKELNKYDVLLLPTYHSGEGYPGIIIEAYSLGIPVISTHWKSIPELVDDFETGILIKPKNIEDLKIAINSFTDENYNSFSKKAFDKFNQFESAVQTNEFINKILS